MLTVTRPNNGRNDESYVALRGEDEAGLAFQDVEMELPLAEVFSSNCTVIIGTVGTVQHDMSSKLDSYAPRRPKHDMGDGRFGPNDIEVTVHEQNMINLISSFCPTYTTESGRTFVKSLSAIVTAEDLDKADKADRLIMWPTHPPDDNESLNGDYGSTTNWKFAVIDEMSVGGATRVRILDCLHNEEKQTPSSTLMKPVTFDSPSRFLIPKGSYHRAALKICSNLTEQETHNEKKCSRALSILRLFFSYVIFFIILSFIIRVFIILYQTAPSTEFPGAL